MEEDRNFGEKLIDALEEAVAHKEGRMVARVDRVEIPPSATELRGILQGMNTDFEREEDRY